MRMIKKLMAKFSILDEEVMRFGGQDEMYGWKQKNGDYRWCL